MDRLFRARFALVALALFACLAVVGCGAAIPNSISGTVSVGGTPVNGGTIQFDYYGSNVDTYSTTINPDGTYSCVNVPYGTYDVVLYNPAAPLAGQIPDRDLGSGARLSVDVPYYAGNSNADVTFNINLAP
jgi:hypothetical protein